MSDNCIFCKIIKGEIPSYKIYEDERFIVMLDVFPSGMGHCLIVPKEHSRDITELSDFDAGQIYLLAKKVSVGIKKVLGCDGINILQNNGECAGQSVLHSHVHVIPRSSGDKVSFSWENGKFSAEEFFVIAEKIKLVI